MKKKYVPDKQAGESLRKRKDKIWDDEILPAVMIPGMFLVNSITLWSYYLFNHQITLFDCLFITLVTLVLILWGIKKYKNAKKDIGYVKKGIEGEVYIGTVLERLRSLGNTEIFHDIEADGFNIDHLVLSERGIFLIETKNWMDKNGSTIKFDGKNIISNGYRSDQVINNVNSYGKWLENLFNELTGKNHWDIIKVIIFPSRFINSYQGMGSSDVWVLQEKAFMKWFENRNKRMYENEFLLLSKCLKDYLKSQ